ncbi:MAG: hypothetical protein AAF570_22065, partial [Bacteroidota bacterium]
MYIFFSKPFNTIAVLLVSFSFLSAQSNALPISSIANLPAGLTESSGLVRTAPNKLWSHNDSGSDPELHCFDTTGTLLRTLTVQNATHVDWEDLTRDDSGYVYIGDFGNNSHNRTNLRIYKIPNPDLVTDSVVSAQIIDFSYSDQTAFPPPADNRNFDMEGFLAWGDSLYLFSKNNSSPFDGHTKLYRLPNQPGTYTAELLDSLLLGTGTALNFQVTGAALSPDGEHVALLGYSHVWMLSCFSGADFFGGAVVTLNHVTSQKEAIDWQSDSLVYVTDELVAGIFGGDLYRGDVTTWVREPSVNLGPDT